MKRYFALILFSLLNPIVNWSFAQIKTAMIFSDNMVLQREVKVPKWGTAMPGEIITISFSGKTVSGKADAVGKWKVFLPELKAGWLFNLKVTGDTQTVVFLNVLIGDVWFASGQSNMEHSEEGWEFIPHSAVANSEQEIADSNYPEIRLFSVPKYPCPAELKDLQEGKWDVTAPQSVAGFSSTAWFFAKELYKRLNVPVGIIQSSWGGTPIQPWMSRQSLEPYKVSVNIPAIPEYFGQKEWSEKVAESLEKNRARRYQISYPIAGLPGKIGQPDFGDSNWKSVNILSENCHFGNIV